MLALLLAAATAGSNLAATPSPDECNHPVTVAWPVAPDYSPTGDDAKYRGRTIIKVAVTVAPDGSVEKETIMQSSDDRGLDASALRAARQSRYFPAAANCKLAQGVYVFTAQFMPL